ncbi:dihydrodipicolinate synthase family protein [Longimicrobium sp.]|uniref:dihydrodipicolinate synthase family protein n=1 Tax=Longimicrobium sp. TaxID=2029185 RepID=UPI002BE925C4|nr:dihydrodipicolinate synthase family protein [Longimicrobium sp.]HSU16907.1 dihydrodipicolinate synthase family protein [Longimicrobium sp.]
MDLRGVFAPATTPFDPVTGDADVVSMRANLRRWLEAPLAGVVLFGSTGEGPLLDEDEKARLTAASRDVIDGGRLLLAGTGAESTRATIRVTQSVAEAGADAVLVQPPAYFRPAMTPEALRDHYTAVADASPIPVILYQVPPRFSTVELPAGLVGELARHPNIMGIKDSHGDLKATATLVDACGANAQVLAGSGAVLYGALEAGAVGGILAIALLAPHECAALCRAFAEERFAEAGRLQERLAPLHRAVVAELGNAGIKAALDELGMHGGAPRSPVKPLRAKELPKVREALAAAGLAGAVAA